MFKKLLTIVILLILVPLVVKGEEIWIQQVGEAITEDTTEIQNPIPLGWRDFYEIRPPRINDPNLNAITKQPLPDGFTFLAVGDRGRVFKIDGVQGYVIDSMTPLSDMYNFTGVSFAPYSYIGWIVGYRRDNWRGVILKTTDGGNSWISQSYPPFPDNINIPFLDVWAVSENIVWISCAHGYVLRTTNGGRNWRRTQEKTRWQ